MTKPYERNELIRPQVLLFHRENHYSSPLILSSPAFSFFSALFVVCLGLALAVLAVIRYKETTVARGVLSPLASAYDMTSPVTARVSQVLVKEGEQVSQGQTLIVLSVAQLDGAGFTNEQLGIQDLIQQAELQRQELTIAEAAHDKHQQQLTVKAELNSAEVIGLTEQVTLHEARSELVAQNENAYADLVAAGHVSQIQFDQYKINTLLAAHDLADIRQRLQYAESRRSELILEKERADLDISAKRLESQSLLNRIDRDKAKLASQHLISIVSDSDGVIAGLAVKKGNTVTRNSVLLTVYPPDRELEAIIYAPSDVVGKLYTEQEILLAFDAFPVTEYGQYPAEITSIAAAPIDPRVNLIPLMEINEAVFKVTASLGQHYVEGKETYPLISGIQFSANFVTEELSLFEFILKPALNLRGKLL